MAIGFCGLGIMGSRMAANLRRAGHELVVWNRTAATAEAWSAEHGGRVASSPAEVAAECELVITMVVDGAQVLEVAQGLVAGGAGGRLLVDMSTIGPEAAREAAALVGAHGWRFVDAPVTGSSPKAEDGTLTIMAGGAEDDYAEALPLFRAMGQLVLRVGDVGQGQMVKLVNNALAAANAAALAQALLVGRATGVDLDALVQVVGAGSGGSAMLALKAAPMREHDWTTLFKLEHMLKDVDLCLGEAGRAWAAFPAASMARDALVGGMARGHGDDDFAALLETYEGQAGRRL